MLNPAPATALDQSTVRQVDISTPNASELRILLALAPDDSADTLVLAHRLQGRGVPVEVVDTTSAGDAFTCARAVAMAERDFLAPAVRFAAAAAALACTRMGVIPSLPYREAVEALLKPDSGRGSLA